MKLYTSQNSQFGKTRLILNHEVKFDKFGCAEVEEEIAKKIISYSDWFSSKPFSFKEEVKTDSEKVKNDEIQDFKIKELEEEIIRLKGVTEGKNTECGLKDVEINDLKGTLQKELDAKEQLQNEFDLAKKHFEKEKELLETKIDLYKNENDVDSLKEMCASLEIPETDYVKKRSKDVLIDLIADFTTKD